MTSSSIALWRDGRGRLSALRIATLALLLWPIGLAITAWQTEIRFEARPVNDLIHRAGFWMLMFLLLSLAVTPLRRIARYGQLVDVRRMIGVGAFCYGVAHISLYILDQAFDLAFSFRMQGRTFRTTASSFGGSGSTRVQWRRATISRRCRF